MLTVITHFSPPMKKWPKAALNYKRFGVMAGFFFCFVSPAMQAAEHKHSMPAAPAPAAVAKPELGASAVFAADGSLLVVVKQGEHVMIYRSPDEGKSWSTPSAVNAQPEAISADGENRPKIAFAADGGLLVSWTHPLAKRMTGAVRLARADDGQHFSPPITVHQDTAVITHRFESMLTMPDNKVILAWIDKYGQPK